MSKDSFRKHLLMPGLLCEMRECFVTPSFRYTENDRIYTTLKPGLTTSEKYALPEMTEISPIYFFSQVFDRSSNPGCACGDLDLRNNVYPPCAKLFGIEYDALNRSFNGRVRGAVHIQSVNNRHRWLKDFLRRYRGVSSKLFGNSLRLYERGGVL